MLSVASPAFADDDHDDDDEVEDDDDYEVVLDICNNPSDLDEAIQEELDNHPALKKAETNVKKARNSYKDAMKKEATALLKLNLMKLKKSKGNAVQLAKAQAAYDAAVIKTASSLVAYEAKEVIYNDLYAMTESSIRSRFNTECGVVDPVDPTPVDPTPVDPTPVDPTPVDPTPVDPTPVVLAAPTNLVAGTSTSLDTGAFRLQWKAVTGATSYKILRDGVQIGTSSTTNFTPSNASLATAKSYQVVATNGTVDSSPSATITATPYQGTSVADKKGLKVYGYIQVSIAVTDQRITGCWATYPTSSDSGSINRSAIPKFCAAAITAQSASISNVSGATATWTAFKTSLQAALTQAGI